jgi:hypothetical protein
MHACPLKPLLMFCCMSLQVTQIAETASRRAAEEAQRQQQLQHQQQLQGGWVASNGLSSDSHASLGLPGAPAAASP